MKDPITQDVALAAGKATPSVVGTVYAQAHGISGADIVTFLTGVYTLALLLTLTVNNWGSWMQWWAARLACAKALWSRIRGRAD